MEKNDLLAQDPPLTRAAKVVGGYAALSRCLDERINTVVNWSVRGVPIAKCAAVEMACGAAVTRRDLRPNDWHVIWPELVTAEFPAPATDAPSEAA
jgi:DNA-binding transcriptional regulator YdaS (Cro superfamily)